MLFDTHCHLIDSKYGVLTPEDVITLALESGVKMICNGCGIRESEESIKLAEKFGGVYVCAGLAYDSQKVDLEKTKNKLIEMCLNTKVVGIGETGLDFYEGISEELKKWQMELFKMHLEVAKETRLPVQVHNRKADEEILKLIDEYQIVGMMHCFSGSGEFMEKCVNRGWYVSIGGFVTFKSRGELREIVRNIPEEKLLLETDAPYLAPEPIRGTLNTPKNVKIVAEAVAIIRGTSIDHIEDITSKNVKILFNRIG